MIDNKLKSTDTLNPIQAPTHLDISGGSELINNSQEYGLLIDCHASLYDLQLWPMLMSVWRVRTVGLKELKSETTKSEIVDAWEIGRLVAEAASDALASTLLQ